MVERTQRFGIALGDLVVIVAVVLYGRVGQHGQPLVSIGTVETLGPFVIGWAVAVVLLGLYTDRAFASRGWSLRLVTAAWFVAAAVGLVGRSSPALSGDVTWPFGLVILGFVLLVLLAWRATAMVVFQLDAPDAGVTQ
jgi:hypothetical protein